MPQVQDSTNAVTGSGLLLSDSLATRALLICVFTVSRF